MNQTTRTRSAMHQRSNPLDSDLLQVLLFYILPFIVINSIIFFVVTAKPKYELTVAPTNDYQTTTATFRITSHMPLKNVTIPFNSQPLGLVSVGKKTYQATLTENGILDVYMQNFNGMCVSNYEVVDTLDDECPDVVSYDIDNGLLVLTLSDSQTIPLSMLLPLMVPYMSHYPLIKPTVKSHSSFQKAVLLFPLRICLAMNTSRPSL